MTRRTWWLICVGVAALIVFLLGQVLTPFMLAAILAYLGNPLVERLERWRVPRALGVTIVFTIFFGLMTLVLFLLIPPLQEQLQRFIEQIPRYINWLQTELLPSIGLTIPQGYLYDVDRLRTILTQHAAEAGGVAAWIAKNITSSSMALFSFLVQLFLVPVVAFYLMRDWDELVGYARALLPRDSAPTIVRLTSEADDTLGAFLRGTLAVMISLGVFYSVALWLIGLDLALLIGMGSGLVNFVPYLGFILGIVTASVAMLVQTQDLAQLLWVFLVFGIGNLLESTVLVPLLVGDRIGLHPVAVIFAVMAGGALFGFLGVLLALPVAAVLAVLWRHARARWMESHLYLGDD